MLGIFYAIVQTGDFRQERTGMHGTCVGLEYNYMQHQMTEGHSLIQNTCFPTKSCKSTRNVPLSIRSVVAQRHNQSPPSYLIDSAHIPAVSKVTRYLPKHMHAKGWCTRLQKCAGGIARCKLTRVVLGLPSYSERGKHRAQCNSHHIHHSMGRWKRLTNCSGRKERWL